MERTSKIFVAGHSGLVGSAICRRLEGAGFRNLLLRNRAEVDLSDGRAVDAFFGAEKPEYVFLAAARVGGILANSSRPVDFLRDNLLIETAVLDAAWRHGVKKVLCLGSSCIYPKFAPQPIREESLLSGPLEPTNEWYAIAKIAGIKLAQAYHRQYGMEAISLMPTNLYGPGDNFDLETSHVVPALLRKFDEAARSGAPEVTLWGTGTPRREFLHVDDLADASVFLMERYASPEIVNVGTGEDLTILELAEMIGAITGFRGKLRFDRSKPDGTPRKLLDVSRLTALGWKARIPLREGIEQTYEWYKGSGSWRGLE
ncbi:MAG: GDP-L-fucose synthase [Bryobacteraceae bacterium]|jgi:GDP-L-fucose synthase